MPAWMAVLTLLNPLTYAVDIMRRTVVAFRPGESSQSFFDPVTWAGRQVPAALSAAVVVVFCAVTLTVAVRRFSRAD
ncbi:hypothetical protein [Streptomyces bicolor]|uniref:hypothetical protein n=1 Tax=Streptomyces bicolor TaxID=66874 RepID=UPI0004E0BE55|nr:hypothetical protein [Streptomyces bicolor]